MSIVSVKQGKQISSDAPQQYDAVVVGAGPYGLSVAAHLAAKGLHVAIFGKPLDLWRERMPKGMFLRSHWWASSLSDPQKQYGLKQFFQVSAYDICYPMPIQLFIDYGLWFQQHIVPSIDPAYISLIEQYEKRFLLTLEDGRQVTATAVVMATGPRYYQHIPAEFAHLPHELLTHSSEHGNFSRFAGQKVAIIGGGQSAGEWAALLNEAGATTELIARRPIAWAEPHGENERSWVERLLAPDSAVTPGWKYRMLEIFPYFFQRFSEEKKAGMVKRSHWPAASNWLQARVIGKTTLHESCIVTGASEEGGRVKLTLSDNTILHADHVMTATGYQADVKRLTMLSPSIIANIKTYVGSPILNPYFESSVPGIYFAGFSSVQSFGPLYRFVAGATPTAPRVAHAIARRVAKSH